MGYIQEISSADLLPLAYLQAKHMVTGYDYLLFLSGEALLLYRLRDVGLNVTLFEVGHSVMLLLARCSTSASAHASWMRSPGCR